MQSNEKRCLKLDNPSLEGKNCSPEQIKECHGDANEHPCVEVEETKCLKPQELKDKNVPCSPEQIEKCHGSENNHPCTEG